MTEFKQIIGRGTRLREKEGKTHFAVMDIRNVTRLFADPDWDGPLKSTQTLERRNPRNRPNRREASPPLSIRPLADPLPLWIGTACKVTIVHKTVSIYDANGKLLRQESIVDYTKENVRGEYASLDNFIRQWSAQNKKAAIRDLLRERGHRPGGYESRSEHGRCGRLRLHLPCGL